MILLEALGDTPNGACLIEALDDVAIDFER